MTKRKKNVRISREIKTSRKSRFTIVAISGTGSTDSIASYKKITSELKATDSYLVLPEAHESKQELEGQILNAATPSLLLKKINKKKNHPVLLVDLDKDTDYVNSELFNKMKSVFRAKGRCLIAADGAVVKHSKLALVPLKDLESIGSASVADFGDLLSQFYELYYPAALYSLKAASKDLQNQRVSFFDRVSAFKVWFIKQPFSSLKKGDALTGSNAAGYRLIYLMTAIVSLFLITHLSQNAAISGDEYRYIDQASRVYDYYTSFGSDKAAVTQGGIDPQHYNAQSFDNVLYAVQKWMGIDADTFGFRHFWNAVIGWFAIFLASLIALKIGGFRMAIITFLLLFLSPRFLGHSYNNHRDIPMAAAVVFAVYFMIPWLKSLPRIRWKYFLWVVIGIAWAYSLRLGGGVLVMGYLLAFTGLAYLVQSGSFSACIKNIGSGLYMLGSSLLACMVGFGLGVLTWPFALEGPVANSLEVLSASAELGVSLRQVFEGEQLWSNAMPWYYTGKWMLITIPTFVLAAFFFSFFSVKRVLNRDNLLSWLMVLFAVILPLTYALVIVGTHYGGWRHFIFVYPFIAILAAMGVEGVFRMFAKYKLNNLIWLAFPVFMFQPIMFIIKNHPFEYMYFNELIGGTKGAHGHFETDYSLNSLKEASQWLIENVVRDYTGEEPLIIATNDIRTSRHYFRNYSDKVRVRYTRFYEKSKDDWDYATFYCAYIHPHQIREGYWPPVETVHEVLVDRVPVGAVVKRVSKDDLLGYKAMDEGRFQEALTYFLNYLELNDKSEEIWLALAQVQSQLGQRNMAYESAKRALELLPGYAQALSIIINQYLTVRDFPTVLSYAEEMLAGTPHHFLGHFFKANALKEMDRIPEAIEALEDAIRYNPSFRGSYQLLAECYLQLGDREMAERVIRFMEQQTN